MQALAEAEAEAEAEAGGGASGFELDSRGIKPGSSGTSTDGRTPSLKSDDGLVDQWGDALGDVQAWVQAALAPVLGSRSVDAR